LTRSGARPHRRRALQIGFLVFVAPFAIAAAYLHLSRSLGGGASAEADWLALAVAIGAGVAGVILLRIATWQKALLAVIYAAAMGFLLLLFTLMFVCGLYGDCL
jgi:hypothetical protein